MKPKKKTTKQIIANLLKSGKSYTLTALTEATNSTKVSTRISEMRKDGWYIKNKITRNKAGEIISKYTAIVIPNK